MGRSSLGKLICLKSKDDGAPAKRSTPHAGGGNAVKKQKRSSSKAGKAKPPYGGGAPAAQEAPSVIDMEQVLAGHASAYASLVGGLSSSSSAMKLRKMEQDGENDDEEEEGEEMDEGEVSDCPQPTCMRYRILVSGIMVEHVA